MTMEFTFETVPFPTAAEAILGFSDEYWDCTAAPGAKFFVV